MKIKIADIERFLQSKNGEKYVYKNYAVNETLMQFFRILRQHSVASRLKAKSRTSIIFIVTSRISN